MKIYILIKPWDYRMADAEVFGTLKQAEDAVKEASASESHYWTIQEQDIRARKAKRQRALTPQSI